MQNGWHYHKNDCSTVLKAFYYIIFAMIPDIGSIVLYRLNNELCGIDNKNVPYNMYAANYAHKCTLSHT